MRKIPVFLSILSVLVISCNEKTTTVVDEKIQPEIIADTMPSSDTVKVQDDAVINDKEKNTYSYKAEDGTMAMVTFLNTDSENTLTIAMNGKTYVLDQKEAWAKGADYEKDGVKAHNQRDDLELKLEGKTIKLKRQYEK